MSASMTMLCLNSNTCKSNMKVGSGGKLGVSREYPTNYLGLCFIHGGIALQLCHVVKIIV